jgi:hypothetical protein
MIVDGSASMTVHLPVSFGFGVTIIGFLAKQKQDHNEACYLILLGIIVIILPFAIQYLFYNAFQPVY